MATFPSNHTMAVKVGEIQSDAARLTGWLPQVSILGVFLFNTTINDLKEDAMALRIWDPRMICRRRLGRPRKSWKGNMMRVRRHPYQPGFENHDCGWTVQSWACMDLEEEGQARNNQKGWSFLSNRVPKYLQNQIIVLRPAGCPVRHQSSNLLTTYFSCQELILKIVFGSE